MKDRTDTLLPCPFCGTRAYFIDQFERQFVECGGCGVEMDGMDEADASEKWNRRTAAPLEVNEDG